MLVLLGYTLALADYFPEALVREIFSIEFLGKLDAELESKSPFSLKKLIQLEMQALPISGLIVVPTSCRSI